jgi:predicted ATP-dependent serine protease
MGVVKLQEIREEVIDLYKNGGGNVFYCGFKRLAPHYNVKEGSCTDWTGYPGSGKTELLFEVLRNCSEFYDHKHLIYMPDAGSNAEVVAKLLHKFSGKQFNEHYYDSDGKQQKIEDRISLNIFHKCCITFTYSIQKVQTDQSKSHQQSFGNMLWTTKTSWVYSVLSLILGII